MGDWSDVPRVYRSSQNRNPPPGFSKPTSVPSWEKIFCFLVGSITWQKLLETKRTMLYHENVVQWNDSAGEEAFHDAKTRFWAEINGLPYDVSLPDPDLYIDEVDWNSEIDPELLMGLDKKSVIPDEEKKELLGDLLLYWNQPVVCTGWGDAEEDPIRTIEKVELLGDLLFHLQQVVCTEWGD
ncbi:hypothetical protein HHK36_019721 [Tetracentron sinense]|uniref:Uncharacterized protein n=1 Tax=Tetracentron sinense TaxID=13715 RepID=A0A834YXV8_TETSI|nr:hypothetical protein HHK36_019721 [Tetracentron sinense]